MIEMFAKLGLSVSHDRVMEVDRLREQIQCRQFKNDGVVCPSSLRNGILTLIIIHLQQHPKDSFMAQQ